MDIFKPHMEIGGGFQGVLPRQLLECGKQFLHIMLHILRQGTNLFNTRYIIMLFERARPLPLLNVAGFVVGSRR